MKNKFENENALDTKFDELTKTLKINMKTIANFRSGSIAWTLTAAVACFFISLSSQLVHAQAFQNGNIFVSVGNSTVEEHAPDGTLIQMQIANPFSPTTGGMIFDVNNLLYVTLDNGNGFGAVDRRTSNGSDAGLFGGGYNSQPHSMACDTSSHFFVGQSAGTGDILEFNSNGTLVASFDTVLSRWIDLAPDQCTMFYTGSGPDGIKRFNVCTNTPGADYGVGLVTNAGDLRVIQTGFRSGQVLVIDFTDIKLLSGANGTTLEKVYMRPSGGPFNGISLDPDGSTFWVGDISTGEIVHFDIEGAFEFSSFPVANFNIGGVEVKGARTCGVAQAHGRMTGAGTIPSVVYGPVKQSFVLHCDIQKKPNKLVVNWGNNKFVLETLTLATCSTDTAISSSPPASGFNTYKGEGTGSLNGVPGASAKWTFKDAGEPGTNDSAQIEIRDAIGNLVLIASGTLTAGNFQAHKD